MNRPIFIAVMAAVLLVSGTTRALEDNPCGTPKTAICHVPRWNPTNEQTRCLGNLALGVHLRFHPGDHLGPCGSRCDCGAAVDATGLAVDLGTILGTGTASLTAEVCSTCNVTESSVTLSFSPSLEIGGTAFTFDATTIDPPVCSLIDDFSGPLGTVVVSGEGTLTSQSQQQSTPFDLTLVKVAGLVCSAALELDSAAVLGLPSGLTVPLSIPCGDVEFHSCSAP